MLSKLANHVDKEWVAKQIQHLSSLKTIAEVQKHQKKLLKMLEKETDIRSLTAGDATCDDIVEIFDLKDSLTPWAPLEEPHDTPNFLTYSLKLLKKVLYDTRSEAYNRIAIDYLIVSCMATHRDVLSRHLTDNLNSTSTAILEPSELPIDSLHIQAIKIAGPSDVIPTTLLIAPKDTFQPLPIKIFPEMSLSVRVEKGGQVWQVSGIADWAIGYGKRAVLEDGTVLLAIEAKQREKIGSGEPQLLAYLATIRQLRIQAKKENVMTQGFFSDGERYMFICIRNNGTVMKSIFYDIRSDKGLKTVFNFFLGMLNTAAESSPNISPTKPGLEQDDKIKNFDRDVFVKVFEDIDVDDIDMPTFYYHERQGDEWPDIIPDEEE